MTLYSDESPINRLTYRFCYRKPATPAAQRSIQKVVHLPPEVVERIYKFAHKKKCSFSQALQRMLDTEEAKAMAPEVTIDWLQRAKEARAKTGYRSIDPFTKKTRRRKHK